MYGLPDGFNADFLCGRTLDSVCVTLAQLYLHFSGDCLITIDGEVSVDGGELLILAEAILSVYALIDQKVVNTAGDARGKLSLTFEKGATLHFHDTDQRYEAYCIAINGKEIVRV
jgi:hypothetical protein